MTTARDIVTSALRKIGVIGEGQTPSATDITDGFNDLNQMLAGFVRKRWLIYHLVDTGFVSNGATFYTVGAGGNYNLSPRPDRIEYAYFNQIVTPPNLQVSYPLDILEAYEDYAAISLKSLNSWPERIFYDSDFPTGKLYVWPIPQASTYNVHILTKANIAQFANLSTDVNLPLEYEAALIWNLCLRLRASYPRAQSDPVQDANLKALARDSLNIIRNANTQIPRLSLPRYLFRNGNTYNVFSDQDR